MFYYGKSQNDLVVRTVRLFLPKKISSVKKQTIKCIMQIFMVEYITSYFRFFLYGGREYETRYILMDAMRRARRAH